MPSDLVTAEVIADRYGVTVATVRRWARESRIPVLRFSRRVLRFDVEEVERAVGRDAQRSGASEELQQIAECGTARPLTRRGPKNPE